MLSKFTRALPRLSAVAKQSRATFATVGSKDVAAQNKPTGVARRDRLQFSKERLTDFGDLPLGEIPEALKYDRPVETSQLSNGVRVATQSWPGQLATISVFVKAGSRHETLETSGTSHFLQHLAFRGSKNRTREQVEQELGTLGGQLDSNANREVTSYTLTVGKGDAGKAVELLGDAVANGNFDRNQIEAEREAVYRRIIDLQRDQMESTIEAAHYTSYRDHMIGQPLLGNRDNINNITADHIAEFHRSNYVGSNIVVVGTGDVTHAQVAELVDKHFGTLAGSTGSNELKKADQPYFTPSMMMMRDDEMANINTGVFFHAPTWHHEDYYAFQLFNRLLGEYRQDRDTAQHLNTSERQYSSMHSLLGVMADLTIHKTFYFPYSDTALWGSYLHGNEVHCFQMLYVSQLVASDWALNLNHVELIRAKNRTYNELLQKETGVEIAQDIGNQLLYLNRPVSRSEIATRIANLDGGHINRVARKWLFDVDISAVAWGPIAELMTLQHYNRPIRRTTLGWYGDYHLHI